MTNFTLVTLGTGAVKPGGFFKNCGVLYMTPAFQDSILSAASEELISLGVTTLSYLDLEQPACEAEIERVLPPGHIFGDPDTFLGVLLLLIQTQQGASAHEILRVDGFPNVFRVRVNGKPFIVDVYWNAASMEWYCDICGSRNPRWSPGCRMFSSTIPLV